MFENFHLRPRHCKAAAPSSLPPVLLLKRMIMGRTYATYARRCFSPSETNQGLGSEGQSRKTRSPRLGLQQHDEVVSSLLRGKLPFLVQFVQS